MHVSVKSTRSFIGSLFQCLEFGTILSGVKKKKKKLTDIRNDVTQMVPDLPLTAQTKLHQAVPAGGMKNCILRRNVIREQDNTTVVSPASGQRSATNSICAHSITASLDHRVTTDQLPVKAISRTIGPDTVLYTPLQYWGCI